MVDLLERYPDEDSLPLVRALRGKGLEVVDLGPPMARQVRARIRNVETGEETAVDSDYLVTNGSGNDVTLLQLDHPSAVAPVHIAAVGERAIWAPGKLATIAGFGLTSEDASPLHEPG